MPEQLLRILIVEDSEDDLFLILRELRKGGYTPEYLSVCTAETMRTALKSRQWDVVTSDYNMPGFSALGALRTLRESGLDLPFIVISGKIGEDQAVEVMKAGAHDYVMKQNLTRLLPAIEREIREADQRQRRREAEVALNKQFAQFKTIFDAMNAIVYVADMKTYEILYMNRYAAVVFGENWEGKRCYDFFQTGQLGPCEFCTNNRLVVDGEPQAAITSEHRNTRSGKWYQWTDRAIEWTDSRLVRLQIAVDITEIKEMEKIKDEMISAVSHEMRTPLTAMLGFTEFLLDNEIEPDKQRGILQTIHKETERLNELIGNFLDMQRLRGQIESRSLDTVPVLELLKQSASLFTINKGMYRVSVECPPDLPPVRGNREKLHQALINLISNACKYSAPGSAIVLSASLSEGEIRIAVQDEGIGIPIDQREKIFEKFYRIDNSDRRMVGGAGLGLALAKEIITAHSGRIWVEERVPKGSTFYITLPLAAG
jgi:signal transduction histidine kinase/CheY-like chemotaxis protein